MVNMTRIDKKMLINASDREEQRIAIIENGVLQDLFIETLLHEQIKGNIYKGIVVKIEPSLQAAFVDYGGKKAGFLPLSEIQTNIYSKINSTIGKERKKLSIKEILKVNQALLVQIIKDKKGEKGAFLSTHISLPGRYLVIMPGLDNTGISRKIEDEDQRRRLREIIDQLKPPGNIGLIVRTAGLNRSKRELSKDLNYLLRLWDNVLQKSKIQSAPSMIYHERDLIIRSVRDYFTSDIREVLVDRKEAYNKTKDFFRITMPRFQNRVKLYKDKKPLFSLYQLEKQIENIYRRRINLKSGGYIVIDPTEALVAIDVNSGRAKKGKDIEDTAFRTNMEAADEIARQLRLRDLGGLIAIDFIDMKEKSHIKEVEKLIRHAIKRDKARIQLSPISKFGLMELSRQWIKPAVKASSYIICSLCNGTGMVKSIESSSLEILRKIRGEAVKKIYSQLNGIVSKDVANYLLNNKKEEIIRLEKDYDIQIHIKGVTDYTNNKYNLEFIKKEGMSNGKKIKNNKKSYVYHQEIEETKKKTLNGKRSNSIIKDLFDTIRQWRKNK